MFQLLLPLNNIFNDLMIELSNDKQNSFFFFFSTLHLFEPCDR